MATSVASRLAVLMSCALASALAGCRTSQPSGALESASLGGAPPPDTSQGYDPRFDEVEKSGLLSSFGLRGPKQYVATAQEAVGLGPDERLAQKHFTEAEEHFRRGEYGRAASRYKKAAGRWPNSALEEDALFKLGESQFFSDEYPEANDAFDALLNKYENSRHLDKSIQRKFAIAKYWDELARARPRWPVTPTLFDKTRPTFDAWGHAIKTYESIWITDPTGPLADDAMLAAANAHFYDERFEDADRRYSDLREMYPKSEHQATAHLLGLRSKLRKYAGPEYNGKPLEEAEKLIDQMLIQFPDKLAAERENLLRARQSIREAMAERDWDQGEFYAKKRQYRSARYYYELLVREYPRSRYAQLAAQRLEETADEPLDSSKNFEWLARIFTIDEFKLR